MQVKLVMVINEKTYITLCFEDMNKIDELFYLCFNDENDVYRKFNSIISTYNLPKNCNRRIVLIDAYNRNIEYPIYYKNDYKEIESSKNFIGDLLKNKYRNLSEGNLRELRYHYAKGNKKTKTIFNKCIKELIVKQEYFNYMRYLLSFKDLKKDLNEYEDNDLREKFYQENDICFEDRIYYDPLDVYDKCENVGIMNEKTKYYR